jgi:hypothetical protein
VLGAGTVINPLIKIVTAVAILAAVGFFIVRPILDTTENAINSVNQSVRDAQESGRRQSAQMDLDFARSRAESFADGLRSTWPAAARRVTGCVRAAGNDPRAMGRCEDLGERLVHSALSDRNFALSYSDSLAAQGRGGDADRVRACVKRAGFVPAGMERCRRLADDLLFG